MFRRQTDQALAEKLRNLFQIIELFLVGRPAVVQSILGKMISNSLLLRVVYHHLKTSQTRRFHRGTPSVLFALSPAIWSEHFAELTVHMLPFLSLT